MSISSRKACSRRGQTVNGEKATCGKPNLYGYDTVTGETKFVADRLCDGGELNRHPEVQH